MKQVLSAVTFLAVTFFFTCQVATAFQCPDNLGIFADYRDRSQYWVCVNYVPFHQSCPEPLHFDNQYKQCKLDANYVLAMQNTNNGYPGYPGLYGRQTSSPPYYGWYGRQTSSPPYYGWYGRQSSSPPYYGWYGRQSSSPPYYGWYGRQSSSPSYYGRWGSSRRPYSYGRQTSSRPYWAQRGSSPPSYGNQWRSSVPPYWANRYDTTPRYSEWEEEKGSAAPNHQRNRVYSTPSSIRSH